jgi:hypothetical protein
LTLLTLLIFLHHQLGVIVEELRQLASEESTRQDWDGAHGNQEKEGWLWVLEDVHGDEGLNDAIEIPNKCDIEIV